MTLSILAPTTSAATIASKYMDLFMTMSSRMLTAKDETIFLEECLAEIGEIMEVSRSYIFEIKEDLWVNTHEWVATGIQPYKEKLQNIRIKDWQGKDSMLFPLSQGKPCVVDNVAHVHDTFSRTILEEQGICALITVPIFDKGCVVGMLGVDVCHQNFHWTEQTVNMVILLGNIINNAKAYFATQRVLQKKKHHVQALFDAFPYPLYIASMDDYSILFYNKTMAEQCEMSHFSQKKCYEAFHNLDVPCSFCTNARLEKGAAAHVWYRHDTETQKDFKIIDRCMTWEHCARARLSVTLDISDSLRLQREQVLERESNLAKGRFLANMSHELRTPLNGIIGMTHLASGNATHPKVKDYLSKIQLSSKNLLGIINDILDFSKLESNEIELEKRPFSFAELLFETQTILQAEIDKKHLVLQCDVDKNLPEFLYGDALRLSQIILNLTNNAIKFTSKGRIDVQVYAISQPNSSEYNPEEQWVELCIKDTGIGISPENIQKLFKEFSQAEASTSRHFGGSGLGLTIVQKLVELMHGSVRVESVVGEGSSFYCTMCLDKMPEKYDFAEFLPSKQGEIQEDISGTRVLLVEDNDINSLIATEVLEQYGCTVDNAADGVIALRMLEAKEYDVVLMDIQMPNMDGLEATRHIRKMPKYDNLPIIAMSAHALVQDHEKSREAGMQAHVIKPFIPEELRKVIHGFVSKPFVFCPHIIEK